MNYIERFKKGRKVKTRVGELLVGSFVRLLGENFFRRVNSDGTLTRVGDRSYEYNINKTTNPRVREVTNNFILNRNKEELDLSYQLENPQRKGVFDTYIVKYPDPNGRDEDAGPGLKVGDAIPDKSSYTHKEIEDAHANYVHKTDSVLDLNFSQRFGAGSFNNLHPKFKALARDVKYQNGNGSMSPIMWLAMIDGDTILALNESRSRFTEDGEIYYDNSRVSRRAEALWPGMYNTSTNQKDKGFRVTLK